MAKLRGLDGEWRGLDYPLTPGRIAIIGRRTESDIAVVHLKVSRRHAEVHLDRDGQAWLKDRGSSNGTFLNGIRIPPHVEQGLGPGDEIQVGPALFRYFAADARALDVEIPGHEMLDIVAEGGMSTIYLARQTTMARDVAVKVLNARYAKRQEFVERFIQEARAAGRLNHPNIIQVHFVGKAGDETYYFTMEYMRGGSLVGKIGQRETFSLPLVLSAGARVADALAYAHEVGIVHRDIKPDNILFSANGDVKLADLGIAKIDAQDDPVGSRRRVLGTPHYMSPEQANARPVDGRSDLYSLGATLYHALAGRPVFEGSDPVDIMRRHVRDNPEPIANYAPSGTPAEILSLIDQLLAKNPADRPQTAVEVRDRLDQAVRELEAESRTAPHPAALEETDADPYATADLERDLEDEEFDRERRNGRIVAGVVAAVVLLLLGMFLWGRSGGKPSEGDGGEIRSTGLEGETPELQLLRARQWLDAGNLDNAEAEFTQVAEALDAALAEAASESEEDGSTGGEAVGEAVTALRAKREAAAQGLAAVAAERGRRETAVVDDAAWKEYGALRDRRSGDHDELLEVLTTLLAEHPGLADRIAAERRNLEDARNARRTEVQRGVVEEANRLALSKDFDGALAVLDRFLKEEPRHPLVTATRTRRREIDTAGSAAAAEALKRIQAAKAPAQKLSFASDYLATVKYAPGNKEIADQEKRAREALDAAFETVRVEARGFLAERRFSEAVGVWRQARVEFFRTPLEEEATRALALSETFSALHEAFIRAMARPVVKPLPEDFPVKELAGQVLSGVSTTGVRGVVYSRGIMKVPVSWDNIPPAALADLYEWVLPPDAPERKNIAAFRAAVQ